MKRTYQPKKRKRARTHGFRARMSTRAGRAVTQAPPRQGPQAAHRLTWRSARVPGARRRKRGRLSRSAEFERVYRQGRSHGNRYFVLYAFPRADAGELPTSPRLGLTVSRKVGGAVERNRSSACCARRSGRGRAAAGRASTSSSSRVPRRASSPSATVSTGSRAALAELVDARREGGGARWAAARPSRPPRSRSTSA